MVKVTGLFMPLCMYKNRAAKSLTCGIIQQNMDDSLYRSSANESRQESQASSANRITALCFMNEETLNFIEKMIAIEPLVVYLIIAYFTISRICKTFEIYFQSKK